MYVMHTLALGINKSSKFTTCANVIIVTLSDSMIIIRWPGHEISEAKDNFVLAVDLIIRTVLTTLETNEFYLLIR